MADRREKLIALLNDVQDYGQKTTYEENSITLSMPRNADIADFLIENGVTVQQWIPVAERLPELHTDDYEEPDGSRMQVEVSDDQWVITISGYQTKARYETCVVFQGWVGECGETVRNVTHWMPLPEPPKGE